MANSEEHKKELDSGFTLVQRKNMRRGKQPQQIYRPGSGPLRKSNTLEESESDTNILINSRQNQSKGALPVDDLRYKSEGNSPRDKIAVDNMTTRLEDMSLNKDRDRDTSRRPKKPEQPFYVPRSLTQSRESTTTQDSNRNPYSHTNGSEKPFDQKDRFGSGRSRNYHDRKQTDRDIPQREWREKSPVLNRQRQGSEPRGVTVGSNDAGWHRTRDTRSVEPSGPVGRNYSSKIQSKPPSGRRHSTVGIERYKPPNLEKLPPRLQKLYMQGNPVQHNVPLEENWDGSSLTFQGHNNNTFKNPSFHQMDSGFNTGMPSYHNQNIGYNSLPSKPRGRGRLLQDYDVQPGPVYHSITPESVRSPCNSRPATPPMVDRRRNDSRPQTPVNIANDRNWYNRPIPEEKIGEVEANKQTRDDFDNRRGYGGQRNDYGRDGKNYNRDRYNRRDDDIRERAPSHRDPKRDRESRKQRDTPNKKDRMAPNRENRRSGGSFNDRRRNNRRDRERRSRSRDYNVGSSNADRASFDEDDWSRNGDIKNETPTKSGFNESLERQLSPVSPVEKEQPNMQVLQHIIDTTLDWSEEVELNDKLEAENLSDALTRSSSITSLQEISTKSLPPNINATTPSSSKKSKRSGHRDGSHSRNRGNRPRQNSTTSIDSRDDFKVPQEPLFSKRRNSRDRRENSYERYHGSSRNQSRDCSWDRHHNQGSVTDNWREEIIRSRQNSESYNRSDFEEIKNVDANTKKAGVIVLPQQKVGPNPPQTSNTDHPRYPETRRSPGQLQKSLFDPNNPNKPIIVKSSSTRIAVPGFSDNNTETAPPQMYTTDQFGNLRPPWYDEQTDEFKLCHYPDLLRDVKRADNELQFIINNGFLLVNWGAVDQLRQFLKEALEYLLSKNIRFCQSENVEQHFWKILYHNIIEVTRKAIKADPENKEKYKGFLLYLIDEGTKYFERLLGLLETTYDFRLANFLGENNTVSHKGLGLVGLALVCAQKLFLFLGDLGRYREEVNETSNYGKCRQWYIKSHEINPKNGKPYNQLALLAVYAKRKLDAVYYYMRSLMSSNPVPSARENLISLFDENRKKYEQGEKKRREERLERRRRQMKQKESDDPITSSSSLRKEIWIHPVGGRRVHRTTQASVEQNSDEEDLAGLSSVEVNKRFVISYLHVHSKLITKIGMETFQEAAMQMLREFRTLMQHSPVPLPCNRFLQLLALNMFAIESTQLRDPQLQSQTGYRSELQERALVVSLQMFDLILERCVAVLRDHVDRRNVSASTTPDHLPADADVLLPAIKVWCDWMLGHANVWNPPPSTRDFNVGTPGDAWCRLATLMNLLEKLDQSAANDFVKEQQEGYELIRLPEDTVLCGFTPLMFAAPRDLAYSPATMDSETARSALRLQRLLFFGTAYLCGVDPPVLRLNFDGGVGEYVSAVNTAVSGKDGSEGGGSPPTPSELDTNNDVLLESFSGDEEAPDEGVADVDVSSITSNATTEIRDLLSRKVELEKTKRNQELHMQRVKKILSQSVVSVHIEVRPKHLVPDTNCFIDHLDVIRTIAQSTCYTLMVPIVVLSELEGLSRGGKAPTPDSRSALSPQHVKKVAESAKAALEFLKTRHASVKCVTTKGVILPSTTFSTEDDATWDDSFRNDDKILTTCLGLCKGHKNQQQDNVEGEPRHLIREVVLLTEDRNLRVKAYARDVPVRELPDFMRWAGLG